MIAEDIVYAQSLRVVVKVSRKGGYNQNFSGLLSSTTTEQLYQMSVKNGLDMDYATFLGQTHSAAGSYPALPNGLPAPNQNYAARTQGQIVPGVGSILVLKPSQDITLQSGQAPSLEICRLVEVF